MIRVLHVLRCLEQGGIQSYLMNLYRNIDRKKVQFDFLVSEDGFFDEEVEKLGGHVYKIKYITKVGIIKYQNSIKKFLEKNNNYKIIHCHLSQLSGVVLEVAKTMNIPIRIAHSHSINNKNNFIIKIYKNYLRIKINKYATHFLACSDKAAKWMFKKDYKNAIIMHNGIDTKAFIFSHEDRNKIRKEYNINSECTIIGNIARFLPVKNHKFLLKIFKEYLNINSNSILMLIGEGKLKRKIIKKARKLKIIDKVIFVGNKSNVAQFYSAFDCFILPSFFEGFGIVLLEAQSNGLNCIVSKNIPKDVDISKRINFISLKENALNWAKKIKQNEKRYIVDLEQFKLYDIKNTSKQMEDFYIETSKNNFE